MKKFLYLFFILMIFVCHSLYAFGIREGENFLVISDIHLDTTAAHQMEINPAHPDIDNDLDKITFDHLLKNIAESTTIPKPKFILVLGDIVGHERTTETSVFDSESMVFEKLKSYFPQIPIFYVFGNNDSFDANYGPFNTKGHKSPYLVATLSGWLNGFLSSGQFCETNQTYPCLLTEDKENGYYSAYLENKLRLISLNTVLFSPKRVDVTQEDVQAEFHWLEEQLKTAQANQESVLITAHIPPGFNIYDHSPFLLPDDNEQLLKLFHTYQNTIIGVLVGHTHMEELKIIKDSNSKIIGDVLFTAGLSTSHGNAPAVKTFYLNLKDNKWEVTDYTAFHFKDRDTIEPLYNFNEYYCSSQAKNIFDCLGNVNIDKLKKYYSAGNSNFQGVIGAGGDLVVSVPP